MPATVGKPHIDIESGLLLERACELTANQLDHRERLVLAVQTYPNLLSRLSWVSGRLASPHIS